MPGRARARRRAGASARASTRTRSASGAPTASTPSRPRFGLKLAGFAFEAHRNAERLERAFAQAAIGAISGAVGTYAVARAGLRGARARRASASRAEPVSTQVVPRDRHAELLQAIALAGAGLERFATEIRHLQRTEVREVEEPFRAGQKGSSAMPHKRNPIITERITGLARVLRGYAQAAVENVALWHERDISHSGAERVILPDATILLDYMQHLALRVVRGMVVHADRMRANLEITCGALFSQRVLLALVEGGMQRDDAYRIVQRLAQQAWDTQHAAARRCSSAEPGVGPRPRRDLRLRPLHAPRARGAGAPGGDPHATVLIYGAPERSADLFHAIPAGISDPFLYLENDGRRAATVSRARRRQGARRRASRCSTRRRSGRDELIAAGARRPRRSSSRSRCARAASSASTAATVPPEFPLAVADHLRAERHRAARRRTSASPRAAGVKTPAQLEGIRRAQKAADAAMGVARRR